MEWKYDKEFPLKVFQTWSWTQTNMNVNEVVSNIIHTKLQWKSLTEYYNPNKEIKRFITPNDDVNKSQSSNDTFPTAMHISACLQIEKKTIPSITRLLEVFKKKSEEFKDIVKIWRTHLQDATPITFWQEFSWYASQIERWLTALYVAIPDWLALGWTAVGTWISSPKSKWYEELVAEKISEFSGSSFSTAPNKFDALSSHTDFINFHSPLKQLAIDIKNIMENIRLSASWPRCWIWELKLPENEPGSSIMPWKVNPTQIEAMIQVCNYVIWNDAEIAAQCDHTHFQLNVSKPSIITAYLNSAKYLWEMCDNIVDKCIDWIEVNRKAVADNLNNSLMLVTPLKDHTSYYLAAEIALEANKNWTTLRVETFELAKRLRNKSTLTEEEKKLAELTQEKFDEIVDPNKMV